MKIELKNVKIWQKRVITLMLRSIQDQFRIFYLTEVSPEKKNPLNHYPAKQNVLMTLTNSGSNSYRITARTENGIDEYDLSLRDGDHLSAVSLSLNVNHPSLLATDRLQIPRKDITDGTWSPIDRRILTLLIPVHKTITVPWLHLDLKAFSFFHLSGAIERIAVHHWDA